MWNLRVVNWKEDGEEVIEVREVYYSPEGIPWGHCQATAMGSNKEDVERYLSWMVEALTKPILTEQDFHAYLTDIH